MDFLLHYRNPNFHSSSSSSLFLTSNKVNNNKNTNNKRSNNKIMSNKMKLSTDPQSVAARERRHRISERFKILRSLIPGGDTRNMDTVSMLEEAIQYVKFLKAQIWLHQTMISFENNNCDDNYINYNHNSNGNSRNYHHYDHHQYSHDHLLLPSHDHNYHLSSSLPADQMEHERLVLDHHHQLGFEDGSCSFKVEDEDYMYSLSHVIYP